MDPIDPEELPKANSTEFKSMLYQLEANEEFRSAEDSEKARAIATLRDKYKSTHSLNEMDVRAIDAFSKGASDYNKSSRYRVDSESLVKSGIEYPDVEALPEEVALEKINNFRIQSQEAAETFDPLLKDDYLFDLQREANELERRVRGRETTWGDDKAYRFAQGAVTGLLRSTGSEAGDKLASDFETRYLPENPEMDDQWISELAAAGGDFATTIGMITAATAFGGPVAGASVGLTTNAARKYRDGYNEEFARSGDAASAFDVGLASMPGAAIETIGDYFVGGKLAKGIMSPQWRKAYMAAPDTAARHAMVTTALKDANVRNKVIKNFGTGFLTEASTEVLGDNTSGLGAFAVTGESSFIPTAGENLRTASIAGLLGGTVSSAGSAIERRDPILNNEEHVAKLQEFIANNDQAGLTDYFQSQMTSPIPDIAATSETVQEPATDTIAAEKSTITNNDDGTINHILKDARGQEFTVDEPTARLHDAFADYLGAWGKIDKFNDLDPGRGRDQRDNINTNNQRSAQNELALTLEDEINAAIPRRAELFSELDKTAAEVGTPQKEVNLAKRLIDNWAVAQLKAGGDPSLVYRPSVQSDVAAEKAVTQPDPEQAADTELPSTEEQLNIELDEEFEAPTASEIEESSSARNLDESANPEFDIDTTNGEIAVSSTEFNPPSEPTLIDGRQAEDGKIPNTRDTAIYNYDEGKITDITKRTKAFNEVGYSQKNIPTFKSNDAAIEFSKKFQKQIAKARSFYSFNSLGMHHNGGILINQSVLSSSDSIESARVLAHELGHAAHSLLGNEINSDQDIKNELAAIEEYLYPGLRDAVANTENADNRFYNYLLSPNELIAEFNVLRLSDPDASIQVAPKLQEKLASVDNAENLVVDRKTYPLGIGAVYSKAGDSITTTDRGIKSRERDSAGYAGNINHSPKYRAEFLKEAKEGSIISALSAARWFPKEVQKLIDDGAFAGDFWKDRLQNAVNSVGPQGVLYQGDNSTLSQVRDIQKLAADTGRNDIAMFANSFQQFIKGPDRTLDDVNRISKDFLNDMALNISKYVPRSEALVITADSYLMMEDGTQFDPSNPVHANTATPAQWQIHEAQKTGRLDEVLMKEQEAVYDERVSDLQDGLLPYLFEHAIENQTFTKPGAALVALAASKFGYTIRKSNNTDGFEVNVVNIAANNRVKTPIVDGMMVSELYDIIKSQPNIKLKDAFKIAVTNATRKAQEENVNAGNNGWVTFEKSDSQEDAIKLNKACAGTSWCTGGAIGTAQSHLSGGNFYVYFRDGQAEIAIRTNDGRIAEVAGNTPKQDPMPWMNEEAERFITEDSSRFTGAEGFIADRDIDRLIDKVLKDEPYDIKQLAKFYKADLNQFIIELPKRNFNGHGDRKRPKVVEDAIGEKISKYTAEEILGEDVAPPGIYDVGDKFMLSFLSKAKKLLGEVSITFDEKDFNGNAIALQAEEADSLSIGALNSFSNFNIHFLNLHTVNKIEVYSKSNSSFPALVNRIDLLDINSEATFLAPKLENINRGFFRSGVTTLPSLKNTPTTDMVIGQGATLNIPNAKSGTGNAVLRGNSTLNAPLLKSLGALELYSNSDLNAPNLKRLTRLRVTTNGLHDSDFKLPNIERISDIRFNSLSGNVLPDLKSSKTMVIRDSNVSFPKLTSIDTDGIIEADDSTIEAPGLITAGDLNFSSVEFIATNLTSARDIRTYNSEINLPELSSLSLGLDFLGENFNLIVPRLKKVYSEWKETEFVYRNVRVNAIKADLRSYEGGSNNVEFSNKTKVDLSSLKSLRIPNEKFDVNFYIGDEVVANAPLLESMGNNARINGTLIAPLIEDVSTAYLNRDNAQVIGKNGKVFKMEDSATPAANLEQQERVLDAPDLNLDLDQSDNNDSQGTIQFQNEDGSLAPLEVPIDQLNDKLTAMITVMENGGNLSTFIHETFHWVHRSGMIAQVSTPEELIAFEQAANVSGRIWKEENYETVARAYEAWLRNPSKVGDKHINVPAPLNKLFWKIASVMKNIYRDLRNSPLPTSVSKRGITQVSIHPDFRAAFERLHYYDPNFRFNAAQPTSTPQNASQSASVTPQLTQDPNAVSSRQQRPTVTEPQLTEDEQAERDAEDRANELNIKLMGNFNTESAIDQTAKGLFKSVLDFKSILDPRSELGGLYYAILDNFVKARVLSKKQDGPPQIRRPVGTDRYNQGDFNVVKDPDEPGYTPAISNILRTIEKEAFELWYEDYASKHPELDESSFGNFGSKSEVQEFVKANKVAKTAEEEGGENENRLAINDNIAELQATLRSRVITDPDTGVVTMPDIPMPKTPVAKAAMEKFVHFLKDYNVDNDAVDDAEAMRIQFMLDSLLNDDTALGGTDFAKQMQNAFASSLSPNSKWKAPVAKYELSGIINSWFGKDISGLFTGLTLFGTNLEKVAGNTPALKALQDFTSAYYHASSHADSKKRDFVKFIADTRKKYTTRKTHLGNFNNTNGIISKLIQVPEDLDVEGRNEAFTHNVTQFTIGVNSMIKRGGNNGETGVYTKQLLDSILLDAPQEYDNFVNHVQEKFPKNFGWINDTSKWIADELSDDAKFISEWLYGVPFSRFKYYIPTQMINMVDPEVDIESFDGSQMIEGDDKEFQHRNPVHVSRSGNLKERSGFIPLDLQGAPDSRYAYGTNLETIAIKGVNNIINDIYTGFDRKILGALNPSSGGVYQELERKMGNDSVVVNHLRKVIANMVNTDLNKHKYVTPMEAIASSFRRNIAPPMLGSGHQALSQPAAQMTAYIFRRPSSVKYLHKALQIMAMTRKGLDVDINGFREVMERTLGGRALPHDPFLTKGQSVQGPTALDDLISSHVINELEQWTEFKNHTKALHSGIKEALLSGLRVGDMVSADAIFATELIMAGQREQGISDPAKINYNAISPQAIHNAVIMMDEAINASMNSRRGTYLANPNALFHLLSIFAGHRIAVATTFSTKVRTAIDLFAAGETNDPMFADAGKFILATVMQSIAFTSVRFAVLGFLVKSMYQVLTPEEDDDRHWLYGELEKSEVEKIRKMADEKIQQGFGDGVLSASIARDIFGNVIAVTAFGGLDNVIFTQLFDTLRKPEFEQSKAESIDQIEKQVKALGTSLTPMQLQDFRNQIEAIKKTKFAPMGFKGFESDDLSGAYGAAADLVTESTGSLMDIPSETKDFTWEEFVLFMRTLGVGQPELTRALRFSAKVKDELAKERFEEEEEIELPEFNF